MKIFNTQKVQFLKQALNVYSGRHEKIAENVANANNPQHKKKNTEFSGVLNNQMNRSLATTDKRHIGNPVEPDTKSAKDAGESQEKVDISSEMARLAENQIRYDFTARTLHRAYRSLSLSITGRNG